MSDSSKGVSAAAAWRFFDSTLARVRTLVQGDTLASLLRNLFWTGGGVAFERAIALVQAFYVARLLGVELFGRYGLVFSTVAIVAGLAGLQLGLTASVHVARHRSSDPKRAAATMRLCEWLSFVLVAIASGAIVIWPAACSTLLFGSQEHADVMVVGAAIAVLSVLGGVQEGVLQGFEEFRQLSLSRIVVAAAGLLAMWLVAWPGDLHSVILATVLGAMLRTVWLFVVKERVARRNGFATSASALWEARGVLVSFSIPSLLASLTGLASWYGMLLIGRTPAGFQELGYLTAGNQWRGTVLFATSIIASIAVPMMSRMLGKGDVAAVRQIHRWNLLLNLGTGISTVVVVTLFSGLIMKGYGPEFSGGWLPFSLIVAAALPAAYANVFQSYLVSSNRMWEQLAWLAGQNAILLVLLIVTVPTYGVMGFAIATLVVLTAYAIAIHARLSGELG